LHVGRSSTEETGLATKFDGPAWPEAAAAALLPLPPLLPWSVPHIAHLATALFRNVQAMQVHSAAADDDAAGPGWLNTCAAAAFGSGFKFSGLSETISPLSSLML
jgi:hypothetical protein